MYHTHAFVDCLRVCDAGDGLAWVFGVLKTECKGGERALKEVAKKMNRDRVQYMQFVIEEANL
jgi:hypothetical protein